jgi:hypothetical protein
MLTAPPRASTAPFSVGQSCVVLGLSALSLVACGDGGSSPATAPDAGRAHGMDASIERAVDGPSAAKDTSTDSSRTPDASDASVCGDLATFSIVDQPPPGACFYPTGFVSMPLPNAGSGGPTAHLMPNSDAIIANLLSEATNGGVGAQPGGGSGGFITGSFASPGADDGGQIPLYFGTASDVVYKIINVKYCGPLFDPMAVKDAAGIITNLTFHAPAGALYSGQGGGDDNSLGVWDSSGEGISAGKVLGFYACCGGGTALPACPGVGPDGVMHAGTASDPCTFDPGGNEYCSWDDPKDGSGFGGGSAVDGSNGTGPYAAWIRNVELLAGHVLHAANWNTNCEATAGGTEPKVVFPASLEPGNGGALACTDQDALAPPNGSLYFLDYTDAQLDCLNPSKAMCNGADGKPVTKLDPLHYVFVEQLAHYGGYQSDTGGPASTPGSLNFYHVESSESYAYYAMHGFPTALTGSCADCYASFQDFFNAHCGGDYTDPTNWCYTNTRTAPSSAYAWETRIFYNLPFTLPGPTCGTADAAAGNCGVGKHLHIADPCVPVTMAGMASASNDGQTWNACP